MPLYIYCVEAIVQGDGTAIVKADIFAAMHCTCLMTCLYIACTREYITDIHVGPRTADYCDILIFFGHLLFARHHHALFADTIFCTY